MPSPLAELLRALRSGLDRLDARWYLFGAQAAIIHGSQRLTADVDVTVALVGHTPEELIATLAQESFALRIAADPTFVRRTRVLPFVHEPTQLPLDVVLAGPGLEEQFLDRAVMTVLEEQSVPVAAAEDIVAMKILSGRTKDLDDVVAILVARHGVLKLPLLRATLGRLEEILNRSDLLAELDRSQVIVRRILKI